jgi:hypothetical protein
VRLTDIIRLTEAKLIAGNDVDKHNIKQAFSSDLMSDVLTLDTENLLLITGLTNPQLIRTAEIADIEVVLLARNKKANPEMIALAREIGLVLLETPFSIFRASGVLFSNGLEPVY